MGSYSGGAGRSFFEYISQVVVYPAGFLVVGELDIKHFDKAVTQVGGENGGDGFDAAVEVTTHPVGGAHEDFGLPKYQMRACSRKLSTIRVTRMLRLYDCPGIRQQIPRTMRSICTPCSEAS